MPENVGFFLLLLSNGVLIGLMSARIPPAMLLSIAAMVPRPLLIEFAWTS